MTTVIETATTPVTAAQLEAAQADLRQGVRICEGFERDYRDPAGTMADLLATRFTISVPDRVASELARIDGRYLDRLRGAIAAAHAQLEAVPAEFPGEPTAPVPTLAAQAAEAAALTDARSAWLARANLAEVVRAAERALSVAAALRTRVADAARAVWSEDLARRERAERDRHAAVLAALDAERRRLAALREDPRPATIP